MESADGRIKSPRMTPASILAMDLDWSFRILNLIPTGLSWLMSARQDVFGLQTPLETNVQIARLKFPSFVHPEILFGALTDHRFDDIVHPADIAP